MIAFLKTLAHGCEARVQAILRPKAPTGKGQKQESTPPLRGMDDALGRPLKRSGQRHAIEARPAAGHDIEVDGSLLGSAVALDTKVDFRIVESVGAHPLDHVL